MVRGRVAETQRSVGFLHWAPNLHLWEQGRHSRCESEQWFDLAIAGCAYM